MLKEITPAALSQFQIGHASYPSDLTGCTVVLAPNGAIAGVDVRGGSPGTRETDLLKSENLIDQVHAIFLTGGSAYGLDVATGIMRYLEEKHIGFNTPAAHIPIVPGAVLFDLMIGNSSVRPDAELGYQACLNARTSGGLVGNVGAGLGATVGKCCGSDYAMKGGVGHYAVELRGIKVAALIAVNSFGDIINPKTGKVLAGAYDRSQHMFLDSEQQLFNQMTQSTNHFSGNTTIGVVMTNVKATKAQMNKIASIAHDGLARTMRPSHSFVDGDTLFTLSSNEEEADLNVISMLATTVVEKAIINAIKSAQSVEGCPSYQDVKDHFS
ncbi:P1 family peptidase [Amphibacillus cookii]|uniref:P1 family peptidase n=1 Tax=Amphibacillus cookii TaxID=767787 RepID=UPI001956177B|nr:P1 family peptidase [Amphibacillus cookii]MBM7542573.1 L-aminopeptidase/D-esterase-like protein [Amphibacillus cookii]